ncbi:MAG: hypothetical protein LAN37_07845 [Acidobacteriia bacterium]|nr:hypothetical protein [Terriglobia bacterium]
MVFSAPANDYQAWQLLQVSRYREQVIKRQAAAMQPAAVAQQQPAAAPAPNLNQNRGRKSSMKRDWGVSLGANGESGVGMFPAKFSFDINAAPSCANDYVAYTTSLTGGQAAVKASRAGTFTGQPTNGQTVTIGGTLVLTASSTLNTGTNFLISLIGTTVTAANLAAAITRNGAGVGVTGSSAAAVVTVTATTAGAKGNSITLAEGLTNFTWAGATLAGGLDATGSIIAFNQLYSTQGAAGGLCNQNGPSVMWFYNTNPAGDNTGTTLTSPVLSLDGSMVAYVESRTNANGGSILHILKWKSGQGSASGAVAPDQIVASWGACTAGNSCIVNLTFNGAQPDTNSSPFYDYAHDVLYVGDNNGRLHKFTPIFSGTPAEVVTGWPITVNAGAILTGPVFDSTSGNIFMGDSTGRASYVREVGSSVGACGAGSPPCLGGTNLSPGGSMVDPPVVDPTTGRVLWFNGFTDGTATSTITGQLIQTTTALGGKVAISFTSTGPIVYNMHSGAFDDKYLNSSPGSITGFFYLCAREPAHIDRQALYRVGFNVFGQMNATTNAGPLELITSSGSGGACSPITEIKNGATDRIFLSIGGSGALTGCATACIYSFDITSTFPANAAAAFTLPAPAAQNTGATSGFVVDNVSGSGQASNIYFTNIANSTAGNSCNGTSGVGCGVKLTQSGLN